MNHAHAPRPTDLVALVSFDGEVYENQAVTRDRLGGPNEAPHALGAALAMWLGGGRRMWVDVRGRQIHGIATARELASPEAWEIDTLVDAGAEDDGEVIGGLLRQAAEAAAEAGVQRVLLRLAADAPAIGDAMRAGFSVAMREQLWAGEGIRVTDSTQATSVRLVEDADAFSLFQLYNRVVPMDGRRALAATFEEWQAVQDRRWLGRGAREFVAERDGRICAALALGHGGERAQFSLLAGLDAEESVAALLAEAARHLGNGEHVLALVPDGAVPTPLFEAHGLRPQAGYVSLVQRTTRPILEALPAAAGQAVPSGG